MEITMQAMGDGRGVAIPRSLLDQVGLEDRVEVEVDGDALVLRRPRPAETHSLREDYQLRYSNQNRNGEDEEEFTEFVDPDFEEDDEKDW